MIVKNEMKVLKRCFDSVFKYLDYWIICDTGSTDGTQDFIRNYFEEKKVPGELLEHKWLNFGHNRSQAVQAAYKKADYLLLMDADFIFCIKDPNFKKTKLTLDSYHIKYEGSLDYRQSLFVSGKKKWRYIGVTHEYIMCDPPNRAGTLDTFTFDHLADGGNRSDKFERDIRLLTEGLVKEPNNVRYMFYLAQSHKDLGHWNEAIKYYEMRVKKGGWEEEVYYSLYQIGNCLINRGANYDDIKKALLRAYKYRPIRLEALHRLVNYCRLTGKSEDGYEYGKSAINNGYPTSDLLFIEKDIHEWKFFDEVALCAYNTDKSLVALKIYKRLIDRGKIPANQKGRFEENYRFLKDKYEIQIRGEFEKKNNSSSTDVLSSKNANNPTDIESLSHDQVTVILNVYKRITVFEKQLQSIINQSIKPAEIWICIFDSSYENEFIEIINKYTSTYSNIKIIRSDINFKYYGRYQLGLQVNTPYVCYYDDDRFPNQNNIRFYLDLVKRNKFKNAILGQWGWGLHKPEYVNNEIVGEWEYSPHYKNSQWFQYDPNNSGEIYLVDYLCGHIFTHRNNIYYLFREIPIDFATGEDIRLSFMAYKYGNIESYCCIPISDTEAIGHNEGNVTGSTDLANLKIRSRMIKEYISEGYKLVADREIKSVIEIPNKRITKICFFCPDYTSIGGSELTISNLYREIKTRFEKNANIIITTNPGEMIAFKPELVITQQRAITFALNNANKYDYDVFILLHGPGQFRENHPRCKLLIYNSDNLLEEENRYVSSEINKIVLHPTINTSDVKSNTTIESKDRKYISFVGSNLYNIIKGSDLFVGLAKSLPDKQFLHVSKYQPVNYEKDDYFGMKITPVTPTDYYNLVAKDINNLKVVEQTTNIASLYGDTRILIVPSLIESFGRVAVEAAINNIPVICSDLPGLHDATFDLAYYVKDYRNVDAFKEAVHKVESNYEYYQERTKKIIELYNERQKLSLDNLSKYISIEDTPNTEGCLVDSNSPNNVGSEDSTIIDNVSLTNFKDTLYTSEINKSVGIVIPIYNRPEYLSLTLESISKSDLSDCVLVLIDDSSDDETLDIINAFELKDVPIVKIFKKKNLNMFHSLTIGWGILQKIGCKYLCNVDADVLVKPTWIRTLVSTYENYQGAKPLLTGFNTTKNNHLNIEETDNYYKKLTVGGINLFFSNEYYDKFAILLTNRMWDYNLSYYCNKNSIPIICTKPSVVQHIGYFGLNSNSQNYDYAYDFFLETEFSGQKYHFYPAIDSPGGDINKMIAADIEEMATICNNNPDAVAFNSNGWLKSSIKPKLEEWDLHDIKSTYGTWIKVTKIDQ